VPRGKAPILPGGLVAVAILYGGYLVLSIAAYAVAPTRETGGLLLLDGGAKVAALLLLGWMTRSALGVRDPGPAPAGPAFAVGLAAGLAFLPLMAATTWVQEKVFEALEMPMESQDLVTFATKGSDGEFALVAFVAVILAPIFEETVFRVHLYSGLRRWMGPVLAALLSASLFSLSHLQPIAFPVTFLLGLCLAWLRERTGGRSAPIAMHACYNAVQMAGILALRAGGGPPTGG